MEELLTQSFGIASKTDERIQGTVRRRTTCRKRRTNITERGAERVPEREKSGVKPASVMYQV
jgi:hypothetical protein